jgi:hypothetical protein
MNTCSMSAMPSSSRLFSMRTRSISAPISTRASSKARPMPTHWCVGSVPLRMPRSWPPPCIWASSRTRGLRRTYSAPMPLGP